MDWLNFRLSKRLDLTSTDAEKIYAAIAKIDAVKNSWSLTGRLLPQTIQRLTQSVIVTSTGASNRIEGNQLSDAQVEVLYKRLRVHNFRTRDEQEVAGYLETLEMIFERFPNIVVGESTLLQLHRDTLRYGDKDRGHKGQYKFGSNRVEAKDAHGKLVGILFEPTPPHLTPKETRELCAWYDWALTEKFRHPLILAANFIFEYLAIHPFQDGNGRTSRLLTNLMLLHHGYAFAALVSHEKLIEDNKAGYYLALNRTQSTWKSDAENIMPWLSFIFDIFQLQATKALALLSGENIEPLLSEKQLALWQWANDVPDKIFSRREAIAALGFPPRTTESIIKKLVDMNRLEPVGQGRAARYRVLGNELTPPPSPPAPDRNAR